MSKSSLYHQRLSSIRKWSLIGFFAILILSGPFHFLYEWSGKSVVAALFFPVNESVWEHLKLGFYANVVFSLAEFRIIGNKVNNYFLAKALGNMVLGLTIIVIFYAYVSIIGNHYLILDLMIFVFGVFLCQVVTYRIFMGTSSSLSNRLGVFILILVGVIFAVFTFYPPHAGIFLDHSSSIYGILPE